MMSVDGLSLPMEERVKGAMASNCDEHKDRQRSNDTTDSGRIVATANEDDNDKEKQEPVAGMKRSRNDEDDDNDDGEKGQNNSQQHQQQRVKHSESEEGSGEKVNVVVERDSSTNQEAPSTEAQQQQQQEVLTRHQKAHHPPTSSKPMQGVQGQTVGDASLTNPMQGQGNMPPLQTTPGYQQGNINSFLHQQIVLGPGGGLVAGHVPWQPGPFPMPMPPPPPHQQVTTQSPSGAIANLHGAGEQKLSEINGTADNLASSNLQPPNRGDSSKAEVVDGTTTQPQPFGSVATTPQQTTQVHQQNQSQPTEQNQVQQEQQQKQHSTQDRSPQDPTGQQQPQPQPQHPSNPQQYFPQQYLPGMGYPSPVPQGHFAPGMPHNPIQFQPFIAQSGGMQPGMSDADATSLAVKHRMMFGQFPLSPGGAMIPFMPPQVGAPAAARPQFGNPPYYNQQAQRSNGLSLSLACDDEQLSEYQMLVRRQLEIFEAQQEDVESNTQGRKKQVVLGQVGIRCRHCAGYPLRQRGRGAVYYPAKLQGFYQAAQNMASSHLCESCQCIPPSLKQQLRVLRNRRDTASGGKQYWADGARAMGLYETEGGLKLQRRNTS